MKKKVLKKIAILAAPIIWRRIRGKRSRHRWYHGSRWHRGWHGRPRHSGRRHFGRKRRGIWL